MASLLYEGDPREQSADALGSTDAVLHYCCSEVKRTAVESVIG